MYAGTWASIWGLPVKGPADLVSGFGIVWTAWAFAGKYFWTPRGGSRRSGEWFGGLSWLMGEYWGYPRVNACMRVYFGIFGHFLGELPKMQAFTCGLFREGPGG